jgi:hypothetical protein
MRPIYLKRNPLGYQKLKTWQQACQIYEKTKSIVSKFPSRSPKTGTPLYRLKNHMIDSGRSIKRNIEYIAFLGFSRGSLEELLGDCNDCLKEEIGQPEEVKELIRLLHGEDKMLERQIESLEKKRSRSQNGLEEKNWFKKLLAEHGLEQLPDGKIAKIKDSKGKTKGDQGEGL